MYKKQTQKKTAAALNWKKWAKSPFFTIQKSAALNRKKHAQHVFIHEPRPTRPQVPEWTKSETLAKGQTRQSPEGRLWPKGGSLFTASLLCAALLFPQCANVKGIFTDDNSTASATPPPDPITCGSEARDEGLSFAGGDGTEDSPFEVSSAGELANIGQLLYCNFRLTQNITLSGNWTPLGAESPCDGGNDDACFQGQLDGNGKMISDLRVNITEDYGGLFGYTGEHAEVRSVGLSGVDIAAMGNAGGLAGTSHGSISNSYVTGTVSGTIDEIGGLVGENYGSIDSSYATAAFSSTVRSVVGGLVGENLGSISNSYAATTSTISTLESIVGGLAGQNSAGGTISNSYSTVAVSAPLIIAFVGGLVGNNDGSISNSYSTGAANGTHSLARVVGGLVGNNNGTISGTNYFVESGEKDAVGNTPVTLDGLGDGSSCDAAVCVQAMGGDDAARAAWLEDSLDETSDSGLNWDDQLDDEGDPIWGNLNAAGFPCLKDMPAGALSCP